MKKILLSLGLVGLIVGSAKADSTAWTIAVNASTNLLSAPMKVTSAVIVATNTVTLQFYDSPNTGLTNYTSAYTNYTRYATNIQQFWTNFFGALNTNYLTNVMVTITNSNPAATNFYQPVFTFTALSNTTATIPNLSGLFINGVVVSNTSSANTAILTLNYTGN